MKRAHRNLSSFLSKASFFLEICFFLFVIFTLIFPSILNHEPLTLPSKSEMDIFFFRVLIFAMFEELIYRVYLPIQMGRFYDLKNKQDGKLKKRLAFIIISNIFFAFAHSYLGIFNIVFAFIMGLIFSLMYENIKKKINVYCAFFTISLIHFFYNAVVFLLLMTP